MIYTTREDAKTAVDNSGVLEIVSGFYYEAVDLCWRLQIEPEEAAHRLKLIED